MLYDVKIHENPSYHAMVKHDVIQVERISCKPGPDDDQQYYEEIEESAVKTTSKSESKTTMFVV